jgi:DNA polymerase III subunit delta'
VAALLVRRDGIDPAMATFAARAAQCHVGLARRLARNEGARNRRHEVIKLASQIRSVGDAVGAAGDLDSIAKEEALAASTERDANEKARLMETLGADTSARVQPPHVRAQVSAMEREQKTRFTRFTRDVIDRSLMDLMSVYRDAMVVHTGASIGLVNQDMIEQVRQLARVMTPEQLLGCMDAIGTARERIDANVNALLALEAMAVSLQLPR